MGLTACLADVVSGRVFSVKGGSYLDVGVTLDGRTSVAFQAKANAESSFAVIRLTSQRAVYDDNVYELVINKLQTHMR